MKRIILTLLLALSAVSGTACAGGGENGNMDEKAVFTIGDCSLTATLADTAAAKALAERLKESPVTIEMEDYGGWEKVGAFGFGLPASDERITALPCEFVLYQGNQLVIFYGSNSWSYTRLGKFDGISQEELKEVLGTGGVTVTLSLKVTD